MIVSESWASVLVGREDRAIRPPSKEKHYPLVFSICHEESYSYIDRRAQPNSS
jgi:hypothetical protein